MKIIIGLALMISSLNLFAMSDDLFATREMKVKDLISSLSYRPEHISIKDLRKFLKRGNEKDIAELKWFVKSNETWLSERAFAKDLNGDRTILKNTKSAEVDAMLLGLLDENKAKTEEEQFSQDLLELLEKMEACTLEEEDVQEILERRFFSGDEEKIDELRRFLLATNSRRTLRVLQEDNKNEYHGAKDTRSAKAELFLVKRVLTNRPPKEDRS